SPASGAKYGPESSGAYASTRRASHAASRSRLSRRNADATCAAQTGEVSAARRVFTWPGTGRLANRPSTRELAIVCNISFVGPTIVGNALRGVPVDRNATEGVPYSYNVTLERARVFPAMDRRETRIIR